MWQNPDIEFYCEFIRYALVINKAFRTFSVDNFSTAKDIQNPVAASIEF